MAPGTVRAKSRFTLSPLTLIYSFLALIIAGALILRLPSASAGGEPTAFVTALFTSTSAVCVTGLVVVDIATRWSLFGQAVMLMLSRQGFQKETEQA